ncbi:MAG: GNAT family N-acetyltransferase [Pseudobdellovibrionaceae bacterium]
MKIRVALPGEASLLSDLAFRSKAYWPYEKLLLEGYRSELELFEEDIVVGSVYVATVKNSITGFYALSSDSKTQRLYFLFVEPSFIGLGHGKALWLHAISLARQRGWKSISFYADSYAVEAFYKYQNCQIIGSLNSKLGPLIEMKFELS